MSEANKALVRAMFDQMWTSDFSAMEAHPGLQELIPTMRMMDEMLDTVEATIHEQIAEGEWVTTRATTVAVAKADGMGMTAGERMHTEVIMMHRIVDGIIVKQHSQGGRIDRPFSMGES